jgi:tRNA/rRNA methyltransferase
VILNEPQLAENIGAVARVMANFGLGDLRLVRPRDGWPQERAWASASGADWVLDDLRVFDRLEEAAAELQLLYATPARPRETQLPVLTPREAAAELSRAAGEGFSAGLLFGGERAGLETADIALTQGIVTVPIDPRHRSLNLAQAVAIMAYESWNARGGADLPLKPPRKQAAPATSGQLEELFSDWTRALWAIDFFKTRQPEHVMRSFRELVFRAALDGREASLLRAMGIEVVRFLDRTGKER